MTAMMGCGICHRGLVDCVCMFCALYSVHNTEWINLQSRDKKVESVYQLHTYIHAHTEHTVCVVSTLKVRESKLCARSYDEMAGQ